MSIDQKHKLSLPILSLTVILLAGGYFFVRHYVEIDQSDFYRRTAIAKPFTLPTHRTPTEIETHASPRLVRLADFAAVPVVLNFWASWCKPCVEEKPIMDQLSKDFAPAGVAFLGIAVSDDEPAAEQSLAKPNYPILHDTESVVATEYKVRSIPETFVIAPGGAILFHHVGQVTEPIAQNIRERIRGALAQKTLDVARGEGG